MSEEIKQEKVKQPIDPKTKAKRNRIITFVCGGVGLVALIVFAAIFFKPTAKVYFFTSGDNQIQSIKIDRETGKIEAPKNPEKSGYDFKGWYDNKNLEGNPIDLSTHEFKEGNKPVKTNLYAKWELHKYIVEIKNVDTDEVINTDKDGNPVIFYITIRHVEATNAEIEQYINVNGGPDNVTPEDAKAKMDGAKGICNNPELEVQYIGNINLLPNFKKEDICDEGGNPITKVSRENLTIEYKDGKEMPVITIYIKNYNTEE